MLVANLSGKVLRNVSLNSVKKESIVSSTSKYSKSCETFWTGLAVYETILPVAPVVAPITVSSVKNLFCAEINRREFSFISSTRTVAVALEV